MKLRSIYTLFIFLLINITVVNAQITVSGALIGNGNYTSLTNAGGAFLAINGGAQTNASIVVTITANVTTESGANGLNAGVWSSLTIKPSGVRTISGSVAGNALINFNGADKVTINGLNNGIDSLIISNISASALAGTSTIRFINDASNDTIVNCTILGACTATTATIAGTILFSTATISGNDKNTISNNLIGNVAATNPSMAITSSGTSVAISNDSIAITGNKIYNWFLTTGANAVNVLANSSAWNISNNKFYQTASLSGLASANYLKCIYIATASGSGYTVNNNTIGYANVSGTGMFTNTGGRFTGIDMTVAASPLSNIQGNTINNINWTTASGSNTPGAAVFNGIVVNAGGLNIGTSAGNTIGASSGLGSAASGIYITTTTTGTGILPIYVTSVSSCNISNNTIGAISTGGAAGMGYSLYGIYIAGTGNYTVTQNTIGGGVSGSIALGTTGTTTAVCSLYGIFAANSGALTIGSPTAGNTIQNLSNNGSALGTLYGIYTGGGAAGSSVNGNFISNFNGSALIYGISLGNTTAPVSLSVYNNTVNTLSSSGTGIYGISTTLGAVGNIYKNKIYNLQLNNAAGTVFGIAVNGGTTASTNNIYNNIIGDLKAPLTSNADAIRGISVTSTSTTSTINVYYNTIFLNAVSSAAIFGTSGIYHASSATAATASLALRNNIIVNISTPSGTGITAAFRRSGNALANYAATSNNNLFFAGTPAATRALMYDGTTAYQTLLTYKPAVAPRDAASITELPNWASITGINATYLHINNAIATAIDNGAVNIATYTDDYDGNIRQGNPGYTGTGIAPDMGADEFDMGCTATPTTSAIVNAFSTICSGTGDSLWLNTIYASPGISYQWSAASVSTGPYTVSDTTVYLLTGTLTTTTYYKCTITCMNSGLSFVTPIDTITVSPSSVGGTTSATLTTVCSGTGTTVTLTGTTGIIQWQSSLDSISWNNITGQTSAILLTGNLFATTYYRAVLTSGICSSTYSTAVKIKVDPITLAGYVVGGVTVCATTNSTVLNLNGNIGSVVKWESSTDGGTIWTDIADTTTTYTANNLTQSTVFWAVVQSGVCISANSTSTTITVDPTSIGGVVNSSLAVCPGINNTLLTLSGHTGSILKWQSSTDGGITWLDIPNILTTYTVTNLNNTTQYRAVVQSGSCAPANATAAIITVRTLPVVAITASTNPTVCGVSDGTATVNSATTYSWNTIPVQITQTATGLVAGIYIVSISDGFCINSNSVTINDPGAPSVTLVSNDTTICSGTSVSFNAGGATMYEFFINNVSQGVSSTTATFSTSALVNNDIVSVKGKTLGCIGNSSTITMLVSNLSSGGILNGAATVCSNANATILTLSAYTGAIQRWESSSDGIIWTSITNTLNTYTVNNITTTTQYRVAVQNGYCSEAFSTVAIINVTTLPVATISYVGTPFCKTILTAQPVLQLGTVSGTYSSLPIGLVFDAGTGTVTPGTSTAGTYTVTYTILASGGCPDVNATTPVIITAMPTATISYAGTPFCKSLLTSQTVTFLGTTGWKYSASPLGLAIDTLTGGIVPGSSTAGTYTVTYTVSSTGGCAAVFATTSVTITTAPTATITYAGTPFCKTITTGQTVSFTGTAGGKYKALPIGLVIDSLTGSVTPSTSTAGTYTVTYTIDAAGGCSTVTATTTVTITTAPIATITYAATPFCKTLVTSQPVTRTGTSGGKFTATPSGLSIDSITGGIIPSTTTAGTYTVTYTIAATGGCSTVTATTTVTITALPIATFSFTATPYCSNAANPSPVFSGGGSAGIFSSTIGLNFVSTATGQINLASSTAGTYTVTNTRAAIGGCAQVTATSTIVITALPSATITYAGTPFCKTLATAQTVTRTGTAGGTYSALPFGLTINASTGAITPSTSTAGTYTVSYKFAAAGGCSAVTVTTSVIITAAPTATIIYAGSPYCKTLVTPQLVTLTGTSGGKYTFLPIGLVLDSLTGSVTPATSAAGIYTITYTIAAAGGCSAISATTSITITTAPSATISYVGTPFCTSVTTPQAVSRVGTSGGKYKAIPTGLSIDSISGAIIPSLSQPGTYTVRYTIAAAGGCSSVSFTTTVIITLQPVLVLASNTPICEQDSLTLSSSLITGAAYSWTGPNAFSSNVQNPVVSIHSTASMSGIYNLSVTGIAGGCPDMTKDISVTVNPRPVANFSYSPFFPETNEIINFTYIGTTATIWSWLIHDSLVSNEEHPMFSISEFGSTLLILQVENGFGCKDTIAKEVFIKEVTNVWIPTAFSPNGDGMNELFKISTVNKLQYFSLRIFNRWGQMVFDTDLVDEGWDGKYKGEDCPIGVYVVVVNYKQNQIDRSFEINKSITLIR